MWGWWSFLWQHLYHCLHPQGAGIDSMYEAASHTHTFHTFQQFTRVLQALCCSPLMHSPRLHDSLWLPIALIPLLPSLTRRQNGCTRPGSCVLLVLCHAGSGALAKPVICLEERMCSLKGPLASELTERVHIRNGTRAKQWTEPRQGITDNPWLIFGTISLCALLFAGGSVISSIYTLTSWEPSSFHPCACGWTTGMIQHPSLI